jgi:malonate transporter and related proteins
MLSTLSIVLPIFAIILAGWSARKTGVFGRHATTELNRYVVYIGLPALLFHIVVHARWADIWQPGFIGAFGGSCVLVYLVTLLLGLRGSRPLADAAIDGLNASYPNTGFMGFPLMLAVFGQRSMSLTLIASIITVCVLFAIALVLIETALQATSSPWLLLKKVGWSLLKNPLILAPIAAALVAACDVQVSGPSEEFLKLLSVSASPCALVALGSFLAEKHVQTSGNLGITVRLIVTKLVIHPLLAWALAAALKLPPWMIGATVLLAALPTGTGPFMLAELYERDAQVTSRTILVTTLISVLTIAALLQYISY